MAPETKHLMNEADIGSGEKSLGQQDVERDELALGRGEDAIQPAAGRMLQSGTHLARILAAKQPDDTYEAQVYVRLTREPEIAETYIPAGIFPSEEEAWKAAQERAERAFREHEF
jgi:hypothetical protein